MKKDIIKSLQLNMWLSNFLKNFSLPFGTKPLRIEKTVFCDIFRRYYSAKVKLFSEFPIGHWLLARNTQHCVHVVLLQSFIPSCTISKCKQIFTKEVLKVGSYQIQPILLKSVLKN